MAGKSRKTMRNAKRVKEQAKALFESKSAVEAYKKTHPNSSDSSAKANCSRMMNDPQVLAEFDRLLNMDRLMNVNRKNLERLLMAVVMGWMEGEERTSDYLKTLEMLSKLVPDFVNRTEVAEYEKMSPAEIEKQIQDLQKAINEEEQK